jgi:hypothetical protein
MDFEKAVSLVGTVTDLRRIALVAFALIGLTGCKDPAAEDYDRCLGYEARQNWKAATEACDAAIKKSSTSTVGKLAVAKLGEVRDKAHAQYKRERAEQQAQAQPPQPAPANRPALSGSRAAFRAWFQRLGLTFKSAPLADGTPREMGEGNLLIIETIGYGDALERTSLTFGVNKEDMASLATATGAMMVFMRETGWEKGSSWVTSTMAKPKGGKITKNGVDYAITPIIAGMYNLSAKPADSN